MHSRDRRDYSNQRKVEKKRSTLNAYFHDKNRDELSQLANELSPDAKEFFEATLLALLGQMPEEFADTSITMSRSSLSHMLFSSMVTGYIAKSVENKLSLDRLLNNNQEDTSSVLRDRITFRPPSFD